MSEWVAEYVRIFLPLIALISIVCMVGALENISKPRNPLPSSFGGILDFNDSVKIFRFFLVLLINAFTSSNGSFESEGGNNVLFEMSEAFKSTQIASNA